MQINLSSVSVELYAATEDTIKWRQFAPERGVRYDWEYQRTVDIPSENKDGFKYSVTVHMYSKLKLRGWESYTTAIAKNVVERMQFRV